MPRAAKIKSITAKLTPEQKKHYDNLMAARDAVMGRVRSYAEDALDCSNADKRGVTTHMADVGSDSSRHEMGLQLMSEEGDVLELIEEAIERLKACKADGLDLRGADNVDQAYVDKIHAAGYTLDIWTVDDPEKAKRFIDYGVDGITSNCAAKLKNMFA